MWSCWTWAMLIHQSRYILRWPFAYKFQAWVLCRIYLFCEGKEYSFRGGNERFLVLKNLSCFAQIGLTWILLFLVKTVLKHYFSAFIHTQMRKMSSLAGKASQHKSLVIVRYKIGNFSRNERHWINGVVLCVPVLIAFYLLRCRIFGLVLHFVLSFFFVLFYVICAPISTERTSNWINVRNLPCAARTLTSRMSQ